MSNRSLRLTAWVAAIGLVAAAAGPAHAATIESGDVVVLGVGSDNTLGFGTADGFSWAPLIDLDEGDVLFFTDSSWNIQVAGDFNGLESLIQYTVPAGGLAAGTITLVDLQALPAGYVAVGSGETGSVDPLDLSPFGDQLAVFTGSAAAPTFVFAVNTDQSQWTGSSGSSSSSRSDLYAGLTDGTDAVAVGIGPAPGQEYDNAYYTGPTGRTDRDGWLSRVADRTNWTGEDDGTLVTAAFMTVGLGDGGVLPVGCPEPADAFLSVARVIRFARVVRGEPAVRSSAIGYLDTGLSETNFTSAATVTLGADVIEIPAGELASTGPGAWEYNDANATRRVRLRQFGSTSRYRLRVDVRKDSELVDGAITVAFENEDMAAESPVTLADNRFIQRRGAAAGPPLGLEYFRSRLLATGVRHVRYRGRIPYDGSGPGVAPDLFVCAGDFLQQIEAGDLTTTARGYRFVDRDVSRGLEAGVLRVQVDTVSGLILVDARVPNAGTFTGPTTPVEIGFGQGGEDSAVEVLATVLDPDTLRY